jgi:glycosyltransferase involved in cell wall biosynthesis
VIKVVEYPVNIIETVFILYKNKISIVHFQTVNQIELLMIAVFKIIGIKIIYTIHNVKPRHQNFKFYHPRLYKLIYGFCDHLVIHSEQGRQEICELFAISPDKVSVIPHGDYKFFMNDQSLTKEEAKINLGLMPDDKTILFFGAIRESKGLKNIVLALPDIIKCVKHIKLLIVGEPCHDYSIYRALINSGKLEDYVYEDLKYIQNQEVSKYFSAADIVVLPYNDITQSGVLQIAYAFGKPVIATAIGGFLEAVLDGKNGFLFPKDDIKCLSQKVIEILSDQDKMTAMGDYSRYLSDNKYSWDTISEETSKIYSELI